MITVPASVLTALGGLTEDDPPVLVNYTRGPLAYAQAVHPLMDTTTHRDMPLLLPASAPALLRVLARHLGWTPPDRYGLGFEFRPRQEDPIFNTPNGPVAVGMPIAAEALVRLGITVKARWTDDRHGCFRGGCWQSAIPTLADITDPMEALAAVLVHVAEQAAVNP